MHTRIILLLTILSLTFLVNGQEKWDLKRAVEYAWANNISVKQSDIQLRFAELNTKLAKGQQLPNANFSTNTGLQWGRSIDPTTNQFTTTQLLYQGFNLNFGVDIYNWSRLKNNVIASRYELDAAKADVDKVKNDLALNIATYYLQALLGREQMNIARVQMEQTRTQLGVTRKRVEAGDLPELNALILESQFATDSANYIVAKNTADMTLLTMKGLLNLDAALPFDIVTPSVEGIPIDPIGELQPDIVYKLAVTNQPLQKANELRLKSLAASIKSARASLYPSLQFGGSLGTNFANTNSKVTNVVFTGYTPAGPNGPVANINGTNYPILTPEFAVTTGNKSFSEIWTGWGTQVDNNFRQNLGISISVPIANGGLARINHERAKLNYKNAETVKELSDQTLKNNIYTAYANAVAALEKFNATRISVSSTQKTMEFSQKRYDLGLLSTFDLITAQNNYTRAKLDMAYSQFDYVFKMKVLEFYKGLGIRL